MSFEHVCVLCIHTLHCGFANHCNASSNAVFWWSCSIPTYFMSMQCLGVSRLLDTYHFFSSRVFSGALDSYNGSLKNPFRCVCVHWKGCSVTCFGLLMSEFMILCTFRSSLFPVRDWDWRWQLAGLHRSCVCKRFLFNFLLEYWLNLILAGSFAFGLWIVEQY